MSKKLKIGLFGFGVVGQGLHDIIRGQDLNLEIIKIAIKNPDKKRSLDAHLFTTDHNELLNNSEINTIVELIDDADAAFDIVKRALISGKNVVSANKKMIASHLAELVELQEKYDASLLYEGAVCGSIPIIRNLEEYYDNELLHGISGIFNGSSNYILSKIFNENLEYGVALKQAQDLGFAETDPILDVGGYDPKFKLAIATAHAYGLFINPDKILNIGIQNLSENDIRYAREKNFKIKLVPTARKISTKQVVTYVLPKFVKSDDFLYNVENEYNGVTVQAAFADKQFFFGKGAGGHPTGAAVLSDIAALRYGYRYEYKKYHQHNGLLHTDDVNIEVYLRYVHEYTVEKLQIENIVERFSRDDYKYVIGNVSLKSLIANRDLLEQKDVFIAHTGKYTYTEQQIKTVADEEVLFN
ncbi:MULTISPECIES: homoserine dehydrogenase [Pedobacter]|uniref:Homoserine dehydrogenase n=1 Tax=Pedobacter heparinus (strain ATCC 13125 / DSM 2366 / CIP 104194 / JCM 7457 / NBRC 12017 / NCIMB 9290 / NRRL B-14731 / HIM 762-3) TaxID=485917 RepID=C6XW02_PEDHD|nr:MULTISPECIES: homoserine dehydrogenase [Pedobacter]ACU04081.1 Homoserine dehydrogenase [Pedobacter heparinus DSM 2366]MBB5436466.1 homoserine dehydrogenase [Pedobacter sp. AK017]